MTTSNDNTLVNLQEEYENRQIQEVLDELEADLVGLSSSKGENQGSCSSSISASS